MRNRYVIVTLHCLVAIAVSPSAYAWLRPLYEDALVVERSELIVIGHLKEGSIDYVPHSKKPGEDSSGVHHARLIITDVLKGHAAEKEIPIIIHYGLTPLVGGYVKRDTFMIDYRGGSAEYPTNIVEILDTGNSCSGMPPLVKDARDDNIWFLRRRSGTYGREVGTGDLGIVDPEDLRPIELKGYFLAYLSRNPQTEIQRYQWMLSETENRAQRYLDHLAVQRILKTEDVAKRLERLRGFYLKHQSWDMKQEARDAIIACGAHAAPFLMSMFDDPALAERRGDIILIFREIRYQPVAPKLVRLLESHTEFWRSAPILDGGWNHGRDEKDQENRNRIYTEVYHVLYALQTLGDASATPAVRETKRQWQQAGLHSDQIVEECDRFLNKYDPKKE
ncbi:MAG: hypothetical protein WCN95_10380 [bacterium]